MAFKIGEGVRLIEPQEYPDKPLPAGSPGTVRRVPDFGDIYHVEFDDEDFSRPVPASNLKGEPGTQSKEPRPKPETPRPR